MKVETIDLYAYFNISRPDGGAGYLTSYLLDPVYENRIRPAMLVIPGGGYGHVSPREGEPIALKYMNEGFHAFCLNYSIAPKGTYPAPLIEACMAMIYIRENAKNFGVDASHVSAVGFSAGGHLLGMLSNMYNEEEVILALGKDRVNLICPDAVVYSYPVITAFNHPHIGSFINLTGGKEEMYEKLCIERRVSKNSPPAFIWATVNDNAVPSENSFDLALAYKKAGVPFELHVFEKGIHGLALSTEETGRVNDPVQAWINLSITWLKKHGFILKDDPNIEK